MNIRLLDFNPCGSQRPRRGFTLVETMIAITISLFAITSITQVSIQCGKLYKGIYTQQVCLRHAKFAMDGVNGFNREIRAAVDSSVVIYTSGANVSATGWGNAVEYKIPSDAAGITRRIELLSGADSDYMTFWDNTLVFTLKNGGAVTQTVTLAKWLTPKDARGAFYYDGATLQIQMRAGDRLNATSAQQTADNSRTGMGVQGAEINSFISPRN